MTPSRINPIKVSFATGLLLLCVAGINSPVRAEYEHGRVEKEGVNKRIARPLSAHTDATVINGQADQHNTKLNPMKGASSDFTLDVPVNNTQVNGDVQTDGWNPWTPTSLKTQTTSAAPVPLTATTAPAEAKVQSVQAKIDYDALEKAYAESIPQAAPPQRLSQSCQQPNQLMLQSAANYAQSAYYLQQHPNAAVVGTVVDTDNCQCGTPIPSSQCMQTRQVGIYSQSPQASTPAVTPASVRATVQAAAAAARR